ncbi:MAG: Signal peptide peptidase SppA, 36K type [Desulfotomaculum sp. 46_296]|nr:MAG: Signal peptide peptidase SppA, 36K type [Desulfotomaculum sp. 46_296]HAU31507.1 signal peptide peptidase SppA [Desulfotomaculum sp.]
MDLNRKAIAVSVVGVAVISLLIASVVGLFVPGRNGGNSKSPEVNKKKAVGIISIEGPIVCGSYTYTASAWSSEVSSDNIVSSLRSAADDPEIKAVVLRINSPGGTAAGSQEIGAEVDRFRKTGKSIVVSMADVAASGAYLIACRADKILANPGTMTGSIGVILEVSDYSGLYNKIGVSSRTFKSGPHKDMGSSNRTVTKDEHVLFQTMVDEIYGDFVNSVAAGRKMELEKVKLLADGRVFTGAQAKQVGLVDDLGNYRDAVALAGKLSGLGSEPRTVKLGPNKIWHELFGDSVSLSSFSGLIKQLTSNLSGNGIGGAQMQQASPFPIILMLYQQNF